MYMITQILEYTKKYYPASLETNTYAIVANGIVGNLSQNYVVGQYINIQNSILNDGTYKITAVAANKLTPDSVMIEETTNNVRIWGLRLPRGLIELIVDITSYVASQSSNANIQAESQGNRSVTYAEGGSNWKSAFANRLSTYKNMYDDRRC